MEGFILLKLLQLVNKTVRLVVFHLCPKLIRYVDAGSLPALHNFLIAHLTKMLCMSLSGLSALFLLMFNQLV